MIVRGQVTLVAAWVTGGGGVGTRNVGQADELGRRGGIPETCCDLNRCVRGSYGIIHQVETSLLLSR